jgi:hypothetical protein
MSLTKERVDNNVEKIFYNNKPASLSGTVTVKDLSKKGWIIVDCSTDDKIIRGLSNITKKLNVKLNTGNLYCKYDGNTILNEKQKYNIVADLFLSKGTTLYSKINKVNPTSSQNISLSDSISITNKDKTPATSQIATETLSSHITLSDDTINKIKKVMKESFSEVLKDSIKNLSDLVEVIKELTIVIDKNGLQSSSNNKEDKSSIFDNDDDVPFINDDIPFINEKNTNELPKFLSNESPKYLSDELPDDLSNEVPDDQ